MFKVNKEAIIAGSCPLHAFCSSAARAPQQALVGIHPGSAAILSQLFQMLSQEGAATSHLALTMVHLPDMPIAGRDLRGFIL